GFLKGLSMHISRLKLIHFRNYEQLNIEFYPGINVLYGKNAQGKTNILEAINICANGKSFRVSPDTKTITEGKEGAYLYTEYIEKEKRSVEVLIARDKKKSIKVDGIPAKKLKELLGNMYVVVFSPEDMKTAKEAPSLRRAFLDGEISKIRPSYVDALKQYTKIIAQKNAALRHKTDKNLKNILSAYNEQLCGYIKIILKNRKAYVKKLNECVASTHRAIAGNDENITIEYKETIPENDIEGALARNIGREISDGCTSAGPHRDDMEILINKKDIRVFASQGQLRTLMLAIKTACLKILAESTSCVPVLLLDDVFAELDAIRKENLLNTLKGIQVFLTTADENAAHIAGAHLFYVQNGRIESKR
ncbi:MAG: DNA replication/repair protein RecF, partial [Christensenella sp.]